MVFRLSRLSRGSKVVIKTPDTDVFIITTGNFHIIPKKMYICKALPAFHTITGCDYTAAFARKGKVKHF